MSYHILQSNTLSYHPVFCKNYFLSRYLLSFCLLACCSPNAQLKLVFQLIQVDWPLSVASLFDWVRFFSFSINVVRPECAFTWKFGTKVIVTLLTPISLSLLALLCGFVYGMIACFKMWKRLQKERRETGKYVNISHMSVLSCWYDSFSPFVHLRWI